jgi:hypothetical protein
VRCRQSSAASRGRRVGRAHPWRPRACPRIRDIPIPSCRPPVFGCARPPYSAVVPRPACRTRSSIADRCRAGAHPRWSRCSGREERSARRAEVRAPANWKFRASGARRCRENGDWQRLRAQRRRGGRLAAQPAARAPGGPGADLACVTRATFAQTATPVRLVH